MKLQSNKINTYQQIDAEGGLAVKSNTSPGQLYFSENTSHGTNYTQLSRNATDSGTHAVYLPNTGGTLATIGDNALLYQVVFLQTEYTQ